MVNEGCGKWFVNRLGRGLVGAGRPLEESVVIRREALQRDAKGIGGHLRIMPLGIGNQPVINKRKRLHAAPLAGRDCRYHRRIQATTHQDGSALRMHTVGDRMRQQFAEQVNVFVVPVESDGFSGGQSPIAPDVGATQAPAEPMSRRQTPEIRKGCCGRVLVLSEKQEIRDRLSIQVQPYGGMHTQTIEGVGKEERIRS